MQSGTLLHYDQILQKCRELFIAKMHDYGAAWRILRTQSLTDQIFIKAKRIRSIQDKGIHQIEEGIAPEFIGMINYSLIALIQLELGSNNGVSATDKELVTARYDAYVNQCRSLLSQKNHDYGEAWRNMRVSSFVDIILMKLLRIKQIEDNHRTTIVSEGIDANYFDIINYSVFALIRLSESDENKTI